MDPAVKQNADDLLALFNDPEKLKFYNINKLSIVFSTEKTKSLVEMFQMDLPYEEIKAVVNEERDLIFKNFKGTTKLQFEHVGSTAIKGMPGTLLPDGLLIDETSPPRKETIQALVESGWKFSHWFADMEDLWFWKTLNTAPLAGVGMVMHVTIASNTYGRGMVVMRDTCNTDKEAFEDYKQCKIKASSAITESNIFHYKKAKSGCQTLKRIRNELEISYPKLNMDK